ncbi:MAG TPA: hypothetical protein VJB10_03355 [Candidatus Peribacteraceae bacterium]|nr:hypothetical protein [Candidatus Peribacteraceae bacterium]
MDRFEGMESAIGSAETDLNEGKAFEDLRALLTGQMRGQLEGIGMRPEQL